MFAYETRLTLYHLQSGVGTALPVIVSELHGNEFEWVGSAYALAATAFLPLSGGLAQVFGRRSVMLSQVLIFAVGSAMCGAAPSLNFLIASRSKYSLQIVLSLAVQLTILLSAAGYRCWWHCKSDADYHRRPGPTP